jgi:hypothetical protein
MVPSSSGDNGSSSSSSIRQGTLAPGSITGHEQPINTDPLLVEKISGLNINNSNDGSDNTRLEKETEDLKDQDCKFPPSSLEIMRDALQSISVHNWSLFA